MLIKSVNRNDFLRDFKVNAMNEEELRKSVRRQKFERQGLSLPTATTPTGTSSPSQVSFD